MSAGTDGSIRLVLFGAPGVGKGTQASVLKDRLAVPHIATGDLLRAAMKADTPTGNQQILAALRHQCPQRNGGKGAFGKMLRSHPVLIVNIDRVERIADRIVE